MKFTLLATDVMFLGLIVAAIAYARYASKHEHLRAPWREVTKNATAMGAACVLSVFVSIAILDSIHFYPALEAADSGEQKTQYGSEVISVLDKLLGPVRTQVEKTYSAPFALSAFSKETLEREDGTTYRDYPRLQFGGAHLESIEDRFADISYRSNIGMGIGSGIWFAIALLALRRHESAVGRSVAQQFMHVMIEPSPTRALLSVTAILAGIIGACAALAPHYHILGTDKVGIDVFYQSLKSIRTGLLIGSLTTLVMLPFAIVLGISAGYFRGWIDDAIQYLYTTLSSIPGVLLIASAALILEAYMAKNADAFSSLAARADLRLLALCVILGITSWTGLCRLLRGETLKLREIDFVEASRAFGVRDFTIIAKHMVPNIMHIVMISIVLDFSGLVLAEAVLSYINIGVDPSMESWGNMINSARLELAREPVVWWSLLAAFMFMFVLVLAANLFADAVRDAFDPRLRVIT